MFSSVTQRLAFPKSVRLWFHPADAAGDPAIQFGSPETPRPSQLERRNFSPLCQTVDRPLAGFEVCRDLIKRQDFAFGVSHLKTISVGIS
jgi:hypothetical protein